MSTPATFKRFGTPVASDVAVSAECRPPHRQGRRSGGLLTSHGTRETQHHNVRYDVHKAYESRDPVVSLLRGRHQLQATSHIPELNKVKRAIVLRDVRDSQKRATPDPALPACRNSYDWLPQLWSPVPLRRDAVALPALHLELLPPPMDL